MQDNHNVRAEDTKVGFVLVQNLTPAPVNVHAVESLTDPEFAGLVDSIKANGIIHRILVRANPAGGYQIIDGHRRFLAAKAAGLVKVPVEVLQADAARAALLTVATNIQRKANDPLLEADLIDWLRKQGLTYGEIAVELGKSEAFIATRAKLIDLSPRWRDLASKRKCTTDLLMKVARHTRELQDEVADAANIESRAESEENDCGELGWEDFSFLFAARMYKIPDAEFDTAACAKCPSNSATQGVLFADESEVGKCLCATCYIRKSNERVDAIIEALRDAGTPAIAVMGRFYIPNSWDAQVERDEAHPQAYVFEENGIRYIRYSIAKPCDKQAKTAEERKQEREERKAKKELAATRLRTRNTVADAIRESQDRLHILLNRISRSDGFSRWAAENILADIAKQSINEQDALKLIAMTGGRRAFESVFCIDFPADQATMLDEGIPANG